MSVEPAAILFDLDGTLTDPYVGIARSIEYAMERYGTPLPAGTDLRRFIGPPVQTVFRELSGGDEVACAALLGFYRERYGPTGAFENTVYPGIDALLASLAGTPLYVCTSKPRVFAEAILEHFGLSGRFVRIGGAELDGTRGDKAELLAWMLAREGLPAARCAMIGDRRYDVAAAKHNGLAAYGVLWGFGDAAELRAAGADALFAAPPDLQAFLAGPVPN
jgi:phosphoglycolate phosphatase